MNSPWGNRAEIVKLFGWTYDYLLWGITWVNVNIMLADSARYESSDVTGSSEPVQRIELKTKADIKKFITGE